MYLIIVIIKSPTWEDKMNEEKDFGLSRFISVFPAVRIVPGTRKTLNRYWLNEWISNEPDLNICEKFSKTKR